MKVCILHRFPKENIKETNAAFPFLLKKDVTVETFNEFDRSDPFRKFIKSVFWIFYAPLLVWGQKHDVIYCDDSFPFYPYFVKTISPKSKVVIRLGDLHLMYYCSGWVYNFFHWFEVKTWQKVDLIIAISESMAEYVRKESGKEVKVALDPINLEDFNTSWNPKRTGPPVVMFHGTITKNKGLDRLLDAARNMPGVKFVIIGTGEDLKRLKKLAPKNVEFPGFIPYKDIKYHLAGANVGIAMRSRNPGNEYVVTSPFLQYSAIGVPCAVSKRKELEDYPYQFDTTEELIEVIRELIEKPDSMIKYVKKNHNARKVADKIWSLLSSSVKKSL